ncbi:MAG TPA: hypothetical protein VGR37_13545 [Longimicrobiaceae bacterium]|nr:hypothetical protein [Longimicrobiaceae bacterium]
MRRPLLSVAFAAAALALVPASGSAQDYRSTVLSQLDAAARPVVNSGFRQDGDVLSRDAIVGMLAPGTSAFMELNLTQGTSYFIAAACDNDCSDMDLRIFSADSTTPVAEDTKDDDYPMLTFVAPRTGRYMLAVDMSKCSGSMCYYGYRVFRK